MPTLIYKKQLISGAPAVTDSIEAGNMKPVTSNAVSGALAGLKNIPILDNINTVDISNEGTKKFLCTDTTSASPMSPDWSLVTTTVVKAKEPSSSTIWINQRCEGLGNNKEYIRQGYTTDGANITWISNWDKLVINSEMPMTDSYTYPSTVFNVGMTSIDVTAAFRQYERSGFSRDYIGYSRGQNYLIVGFSIIGGNIFMNVFNGYSTPLTSEILVQFTYHKLNVNLLSE